MKQIITIFLTLALVLCLATPALAMTPDLGVPDMPEIPDISDDIDFGIDFGSIIGGWFEKNPAPPLTPTEPVEVPTEPVEVPTKPIEELPAPVGGGWFDWLRNWSWWGRM